MNSNIKKNLFLSSKHADRNAYTMKSIISSLFVLALMCFSGVFARGGDDAKPLNFYGLSGDLIGVPIQDFEVPGYGVVPVVFVGNQTLSLIEGNSGRGHEVGYVRVWYWLDAMPPVVECDPAAPCHDDPITTFNVYARIFRSSGVIGALSLGVQRSPMINPVGDRDVSYVSQCGNPLTDMDFTPNIVEGTQQFRDIIGCVAFAFTANNDQSPNLLKINGGVQIITVGGFPQI